MNSRIFFIITGPHFVKKSDHLDDFLLQVLIVMMVDIIMTEGTTEAAVAEVATTAAEVSLM